MKNLFILFSILFLFLCGIVFSQTGYLSLTSNSQTGKPSKLNFANGDYLVSPNGNYRLTTTNDRKEMHIIDVSGPVPTVVWAASNVNLGLFGTHRMGELRIEYPFNPLSFYGLKLYSDGILTDDMWSIDTNPKTYTNLRANYVSSFCLDLFIVPIAYYYSRIITSDVANDVIPIATRDQLLDLINPLVAAQLIPQFNQYFDELDDLDPPNPVNRFLDALEDFRPHLEEVQPTFNHGQFIGSVLLPSFFFSRGHYLEVSLSDEGSLEINIRSSLLDGVIDYFKMYYPESPFLNSPIWSTRTSFNQITSTKEYLNSFLEYLSNDIMLDVDSEFHNNQTISNRFSMISDNDQYYFMDGKVFSFDEIFNAFFSNRTLNPKINLKNNINSSDEFIYYFLNESGKMIIRDLEANLETDLPLGEKCMNLGKDVHHKLRLTNEGDLKSISAQDKEFFVIKESDNVECTYPFPTSGYDNIDGGGSLISAVSSNFRHNFNSGQKYILSKNQQMLLTFHNNKLVVVEKDKYTANADSYMASHPQNIVRTFTRLYPAYAIKMDYETSATHVLLNIYGYTPTSGYVKLEELARIPETIFASQDFLKIDNYGSLTFFNEGGGTTFWTHPDHDEIRRLEELTSFLSVGERLVDDVIEDIDLESDKSSIASDNGLYEFKYSEDGFYLYEYDGNGGFKKTKIMFTPN